MRVDAGGPTQSATDSDFERRFCGDDSHSSNTVDVTDLYEPGTFER